MTHKSESDDIVHDYAPVLKSVEFKPYAQNYQGGGHINDHYGIDRSRL